MQVELSLSALDAETYEKLCDEGRRRGYRTAQDYAHHLIHNALMRQIGRELLTEAKASEEQAEADADEVRGRYRASAPRSPYAGMW